MKRLLSISILLLFAYSGYCQMASRNGYYLAPYDTLKVLIVFAEIDYSGDTLFSDPDTYPDAWDAGALPDWKDDLLDPTWSGSPQAKLTKYYYEASFGKLIVLGDYLIPDTGQIAPIVIPSEIISIVTIDGEDVRYFDDTYLIPYISPQYGSFKTNSNCAQSKFDLWSTSSYGTVKSNTPNGNYDEVWFFVRNSIFPTNNSGHSGSGTGSIFGVSSDFHSTVRVSNIFPKNIMTHELNHWFLGPNSFHAGGGLGKGDGYVIAAQGGWSMLGGANSAFLTCNAWDRRRMNWKTPTSYPINARDSLNQNNVYADFDAADSTDEGTYILRDFWTTGDALRIKLPHIPSGKHQQWLWIEFHETVSGNQSEFDDFMFGDSPCIDEPIAGLYAYIQIEKEDKSGALTYAGYGDYLRFLSARGHFDVDSSATRSTASCIVGGQQNPLILSEDNPLTGLSTFEERPMNLDTNSRISKDEGLR